ncbi:MAG: cyanophycinase [Planctomycetaceae bacterium]|jgi:cyanophycinase|nr:cyanophycinase [Planctomycetaceae bacterium]
MKNNLLETLKTLKKVVWSVLPAILLVILSATITFQTTTFPVYAQNPIKIQTSETRHGPENGALVIIGGGGVTPEIWDKILELAGGKERAKFVVVTNAGGDGLNTRSGTARSLKEKIGEENVRILDLKTIHEANDEKNLEFLKQATGVFFDGGRQWRIADAYLNTLTHQEFQNVLARGGVIAGSSAGASIQGSFLWRGDTKTPDILVGDHTQGLAFLKNSVIDQHILARNRQFDLIEFVKGAPQLIGLGIDESTAVVVIKDELEVVGKSIVAVHSYPNTIPNTNFNNANSSNENPNNVSPNNVNSGNLNLDNIDPDDIDPDNADQTNVNPNVNAGNPETVNPSENVRRPFVRYTNGSADAYKPFIVLRHGQKYNLKERRVIPQERRGFNRGAGGFGAPTGIGNPPSGNAPENPSVNQEKPQEKPKDKPENEPVNEKPAG